MAMTRLARNERTGVMMPGVARGGPADGPSVTAETNAPCGFGDPPWNVPP